MQNNNNNNFNNFKNQSYIEEKKLEINNTNNIGIIPTNLNNTENKEENNNLTTVNKNLNIKINFEKKLDVPKINDVEIIININDPENSINTKGEEKNLSNSNFLNKKLKKNPSQSQEFKEIKQNSKTSSQNNDSFNYLKFQNEIEKIKKTLKTKYENLLVEPKKYHLNYDAFEKKIKDEEYKLKKIIVNHLEKEIFTNKKEIFNKKTENKITNLKNSIFKKIKNFEERLNEVEEDQKINLNSNNEKNLDSTYFDHSYYYNFYTSLEKEIKDLFKRKLIDENLQYLLELACEEYKHKAQETYYSEKKSEKNSEIKDEIIIEPKIFKNPVRHQIMNDMANSTIDSLNSILMSENSKIFFIKTTPEIKKGKRIQ